MKQKISHFQYLLFASTTSLAAIFNILIFQNQIAGIIIGFFYLAFCSQIIGTIFIKKTGWQIIFGFLFFLALIASLGAGSIYFLNFNNLFFCFLLILIPAIAFIPYYFIFNEENLSLIKIIKKYQESFFNRKEKISSLIIVFLYLISVTCLFFLLFIKQTTETIQSPWQIISIKFFYIYFFASFLLVYYLLVARRQKLPLGLIIIHTFLSSSIALIIYKIGYGFDPFIHQATEKIIAQTGTISPKPLYYLGQYSIVLFLNKLLLIDIVWLDKILVPIIFAIYLPLTIFFVFSHWLKKNYALVLAFSIILVPYNFFIMTAPQNLANLFFIITVLLAWLYFRNEISIFALGLLTTATLAIHPMAGIPLLITITLFFLYQFFYKSYSKHLKLYFFSALSFIILLPLAFVSNGLTGNLTWPKIHRADFTFFTWIDKFDLFLNLTYLFRANLVIVAGLLIILGLFHLKNHKLLKNNFAFLTAGFVIFCDYFFIKFCFDFPALRSNDQNEFVSRLLLLTFYLLLPFLFIGLANVVEYYWEKSFSYKNFLILSFTGLATISLYLSYPRLDQYEPSKFYSVSSSDIKAVNLIEQRANPEHIVLANQMIGAAAIQEFGFKKYYNNQFYYSMPMGVPQRLYEFYLEMIYQGAKKETMINAMTEAGVSESYFVLNQYWKNFEKIKQQAILSADEYYSIDDGKIFVFKYSK